MSRPPVPPRSAGQRAKPWLKPAVEPAPMPPGLQARISAAAILAEVVGAGHPLDEFFAGDQTHPKLVAFDARDRALIRSMITVSLRRLGTIRRALARFLERGMPKKAGTLEWILIITAAQILFLDIPDHAAVNLAVRAVRLDPLSLPFASLANAVGRNLARERDELIETDPIIDCPTWLANRWRQVYGDETTASIAAANRREPRLDLTVMADPDGWAERLNADLLPTGSLRLRTNVPVPELAGFDEGAWWVQDAAAAIPARLLRVEHGERIADLCAAPGGKTAQLIAAGGQVVAVDRSAERLKRLAANLQRLNLTVETKVADVTSYDAPPFDAVLLDAPCSATGTMRRHPDVGWTKRLSDLASLTALQSKMLDRAVALLKPSGRLVYCVCSLEPEEGEAQIAALLRRNPDITRAPITADEVFGQQGWLTERGELRTLPHFRVSESPPLDGLDGFFAARLIRKSG